jgi:hypothetical protein
MEAKHVAPSWQEVCRTCAQAPGRTTGEKELPRPRARIVERLNFLEQGRHFLNLIDHDVADAARERRDLAAGSASKRRRKSLCCKLKKRVFSAGSAWRSNMVLPVCLAPSSNLTLFLDLVPSRLRSSARRRYMMMWII